MCGIFGYIGKSFDAPGITFTGIKDLEYRGYDSWGVAFLEKNKLRITKKAGKIGGASIGSPSSQISIAHTRWATHGGVTDSNAHPHMDCTKRFALIHNGIFENHLDFKQKLTADGHKFISQTDTEVAVHMLEEAAQETGFENAFLEVFNKIKGLNALIAIDTQGDKIMAAKNGSPLVIGIGDGENFVASDSQAITRHTKKVYFMEDFECAILTKKSVKVINTKTGKVIKPHIKILHKVSDDDDMGKYKNFMLKEINEQPDLLLKLAGSDANIRFLSNIKQHNKNYLIGCGSAYFAALAGQYLFAKNGVEISAVQASEFTNLKPFIGKDTNIIAISQSGETMDLLEALKYAHSKKANIDSITNVYGASVYRMSGNSILLEAGREKAVASTKALTLMIANLIKLNESLNYKSVLQNISNASKKVIRSKIIPKIARKLINSKSLYVIGRGLNYVSALETALKIKEISYIHAEALAAGELKHGALALIEKNTPVILFAPNDETQNDMMSAAFEIKARGGKIVGISNINHEVFDHFINVESCGNGTIIPNIIAGQLFAYHLAILKKLDPDKPRNLAKSVTVK